MGHVFWASEEWNSFWRSQRSLYEFCRGQSIVSQSRVSLHWDYQAPINFFCYCGQASMEIGDLGFCRVPMNCVTMTTRSAELLEHYQQNGCHVCKEIGCRACSLENGGGEEKLGNLGSRDSRQNFRYRARPKAVGIKANSVDPRGHVPDKDRTISEL